MIIRTIKFRADLLCESGLHIGNKEGGNPTRGLNAPLLQNPVLQIDNTFAPYISASAIKGKLRNIAEILFEKEFNREFGKRVDDDGKETYLHRHECDSVESAKQCKVCFLFGSASGSGKERADEITNENFFPRLVIRNAHLKDTEDKPKDSEIKTENTLKRLRLFANPRSIERVPRNAVFEFEINYNVHDGEDDQDTIHNKLSHLMACLRFLEQNYLGGNGSRGYGNISFNNIFINENKKSSLEELHRSIIQKEEEL